MKPVLIQSTEASNIYININHVIEVKKSKVDKYRPYCIVLVFFEDSKCLYYETEVERDKVFNEILKNFNIIKNE